MRQFCTIRIFLSLLVVFLLPLLAVAQAEASGESLVLTSKLDNLVQGRLYSPSYFPIKGNPFLTDEWSLENIRLLGKDYLDLPVWYDIYLDDLILLNQQGANLRFLRLVKEHVQRFNLGARRFVNLAYSRYQDLPLKEGYYEIAFEDQVSLLVSRSLKVLEEDKSLIPYFNRDDQWFLVKDGKAFGLRNKKDFLRAAGIEHKRALKAFIKRQKIRFFKAGDPEWLQMVTYLNALQSDQL